MHLEISIGKKSFKTIRRKTKQARRGCFVIEIKRMAKTVLKIKIQNTRGKCSKERLKNEGKNINNSN